jgi:hypothetical protein
VSLSLFLHPFTQEPIAMILSHRVLSLGVLTLVAVAGLPACNSSSASGAGGSGVTTTTNALEPLTSCDDDDIMDSFVGPGYDATKGGLQPPVQATYVAATTVLLQSSDADKQKLFGQLVSPVLSDVLAAPGFVGFQVGVSSKCHYARTLTVWKDMDSMMSFVMTPNHVNAMSHASEASDAGATTNWEIASADFPPTWAMARAQILKTGTPAY